MARGKRGSGGHLSRERRRLWGGRAPPKPHGRLCRHIGDTPGCESGSPQGRAWDLLGKPYRRSPRWHRAGRRGRRRDQQRKLQPWPRHGLGSHRSSDLRCCAGARPQLPARGGGVSERQRPDRRPRRRDDPLGRSVVLRRDRAGRMGLARGDGRGRPKGPVPILCPAEGRRTGPHRGLLVAGWRHPGWVPRSGHHLEQWDDLPRHTIGRERLGKPAHLGCDRGRHSGTVSRRHHRGPRVAEQAAEEPRACAHRQGWRDRPRLARQEDARLP
mmetsp:Transcript_39646/g.94116  ORF Transcript_39646/g.94116 Transcript_39646/m.94116 type:complete len:271 (+) Transcript_39646:1014-1826(+)